MKLLVITNIPTPYRNFLFERMYEKIRSCGGEFMVYFMAWTEHGRNWKICKKSIEYPAVVHKDISFGLGNRGFHFNPGIISFLKKNKFDIIIFGGWYSPTHWIALMVAKLITHSRLLLWSETNRWSETKSSRPFVYLKRWYVKQFSGYVVPGKRSLEYLELLTNNHFSDSTAYLPNLIDPNNFIARVDYHRFDRRSIRAEIGLDDQAVMCFVSARLEYIKGIDLLIKAMAGHNNAILVVAGDGREKAQLEKEAKDHNVRVLFLGFQSEDMMLRYYAAADLFALPSRRDPSPLAAIEAIAAGLPILISSTVGNRLEVLEEAQNGFTFDVDNFENARNAVNRVFDLDASQRAVMGVKSRNIFLQRFDPDIVLEQFLNKLGEMINGNCCQG